MTHHKIMIVGEAWGTDEAAAGRPFVGYTGRLLRGLLREVGIDPSETFMTNVFNFQPKPTNDIKNLTGLASEKLPGYPKLGQKYIRAEFAPELERLHAEVEKVNPNLIIAVGNTPSWALCHTSGIAKIRGAPLYSTTNRKVLPTYHPSAVMRDWKLRPIVLADLMKAKREAEFPEIRRPKRTLWIEPTLDDCFRFVRRYILPSPVVSVDVETLVRQIDCVGLAPSPEIAIVIPFYDPRQKDGNYWRRPMDEIAVWDLIRSVLTSDKQIVGQNFMYDMRFFWESYGIPITAGRIEDTMLHHHALQPEMQKSLDFLASIYTDELKWKFMGRGGSLTRKEED